MTRSSILPQQKAARYALILSLGIVFGLGVYLSFLDENQSLTTKLASLGLNLVASGFFAVVFTYLSDRERQLAVAEEINSAFSRHSQDMMSEWRSQLSSYVPAGQFMPTSGFDPTFNNRLITELSKSQWYIFRGVTAKYVPIRLACISTPPANVTVILPDPRSPVAMKRRVADRALNPKYSSREPDRLLEDILEELRQSIVGLFDQRFRCTIRIAFSVETFVTRTEMTEHTAFLSMYHGSNSRAQRFPESVEFSSASFYYHIEKMECERRLELSDQPVTFDYRTAETELLVFLNKLFIVNTVSSDLPALRSAFESRMSTFNHFLRGL